MTAAQTEPRIITPGQAVVAAAGQWTNREAQIIGTSIAPGLDQNDLRVFAMICRHTGMDPFKRQIYAWKDKGRIAIHIGINGWRGIASRSGEYAGQVGPFWCGQDGVWMDVWLSDEAPAAARVGVVRKGSTEPVWGIATMKEFGRPLPIWKEKPAHMLAIRAEYQALQKACPEAYAGALQVISESKAILDVGDESEIPAPPPNVDPETGEIRDVTPVDRAESPGSERSPSGERGDEGAGAPGSVAPGTEPAPSEPATASSAQGGQAEGGDGHGAPDHPQETAIDTPSAQQPGLLDPTPFRFEMTEATWAAYCEEMEAKGIEAAAVNRYLGKAANAKNVEAWCREHQETPFMLLDRVKSAGTS